MDDNDKIRTTHEMLEVTVNLDDATFTVGQLTNFHLGQTIVIAGEGKLEGVLTMVIHLPYWVIGELRGSFTETTKFACPSITPVEFRPDLLERN